MAKPIRPKICVGPHVTPGKVNEWSKEWVKYCNSMNVYGFYALVVFNHFLLIGAQIEVRLVAITIKFDSMLAFNPLSAFTDTPFNAFLIVHCQIQKKLHYSDLFLTFCSRQAQIIFILSKKSSFNKSKELSFAHKFWFKKLYLCNLMV